ncbi:hypothetical protein CBS147333_4747 [Penicillium roqueforti]|nr:hypothetical protein CBS147333_4747 [Penicillium roqueforti]KAI3269864.1 hypothetical protein CBS147308_5038 [Penicillium roqueforti]KAI3285600.1 hypothetical protein DTO002I6_8591 [Penicillium roqueforti]KAI3286553.1 hypothetical protein DTO003C3_6838 [Penicillium roqueforti]
MILCQPCICTAFSVPEGRFNGQSSYLESGPITQSRARQHIQHMYGVAAVEGRGLGLGGVKRVTPKQRREERRKEKQRKGNE